ncbi:P pilus assembly chaperone PapD [Pseudomonas chlororaphis]|uniref:fimbrial biogenesis chaperone n=1 Tax=Pseudomonas chlororaphis TaxID=587753 RepID=UPI0020A0F0CD|nr:molecular chaperone [Pseudomonas chlororaphis]MCP1481997.1 P pilus assembly chaperone PapD [Pseudomonas chlororaphis]MCP1597644.1 P pilus assembly chaperone PapD [Pseudomonas chlororaphis]
MRPYPFFLLAALLAAPQLAPAAVVIAGTRVVYPMANQEVTLQLRNAGGQPALVQSWIDSEDSARTASDSDAPFVIMPPIARIGPGSSQTLRIVYTGEPVSEVRESVYWLNVLDIPPRPADIGEKNYMQVSIRSKIKLFFRPAGLQGSPDKAPEQLQWSLARRAGKTVLKVSNPSHYHVSLSSVKLSTGAKLLTAGDGMVGPGQELEFPLTSGVAVEPGKSSVQYDWINDYGAAISTRQTF